MTTLTQEYAAQIVTSQRSNDHYFLNIIGQGMKNKVLSYTLFAIIHPLMTVCLSVSLSISLSQLTLAHGYAAKNVKSQRSNEHYFLRKE